MTESMRLNKRLIQQLGCSRREAELYIEGGWVTVDGVIVEEPQFQVDDQIVELLPNADTTSAGPITLVMNLAADLNKDQTLAQLIAANRWADDKSGIRMLKRHIVQIKPCLPLQPGIAGMQVLSQDWNIQRKLSEDAALLEQEFVVDVEGELPPEALKLLNFGLSFQGKPLPPIKVSWQSETRLRFALKNPLPNQIQYMCDRVGLKIIALKRIRIGAVPLSKMALGQWRYLTVRDKF